MPLLDIDPSREITKPRDAATVILVRDGESGPEVFCVKRHTKSAFLGGAIVFPGGKVDPKDHDPFWASVANAPQNRASFGDPMPCLLPVAIAACRELLEEAALLPTLPRDLSHDDLLQLRADALALGFRAALAPLLARQQLTIDVARLLPFARWVTPTAEARRFDTRFYIARAPTTSVGAHDAHETTDSFWASCPSLLSAYDRGEIQLAPPTHRTLDLFRAATSADSILDVARGLSLDPICPEVVQMVHRGQEALALVLPGDPEHSIREARVPGLSRFVLEGERWVATSAPADKPLPR